MHRFLRAVLWGGGALCSAGCVGYTPAPVEPRALLAELERVPWRAPADVAVAPGPRALSAFAVEHNPALQASRARVEVSAALLVEAGLLPEPSVGWDAMDVLAAQLVDGRSTRVDVLAGLGLDVPLRRPGEGDALRAGARWNHAAEHAALLAAEWRLVSAVYVADEELRVATELAAQAAELARLAERTEAHFRAAQEAGAASAIEANLARGELRRLRVEHVRAEARREAARRHLAELLGLPPSAALVPGAAEDPLERAARLQDDEGLAVRALAVRPDLAALSARYGATEAALRLAVATQYPRVTVGTGLSLSLPLGQWRTRAAIAAAQAERARAGEELRAAVHALRAELADAQAAYRLASEELELVERELLPNAEESLALARAALEVGEASLLETLALQRALAEARTRDAEARGVRAKAAWELLAAAGELLAPATDSVPAALDEDPAR
ncbi:MAG: TolC family protein [Planctomycetes bacterium]|nr:TolC family protein [Planctomycetota bacterium]